MSTGQRFREYCRERGLDPQQISHLGDSIHLEADERMRRELAEGRDLIAEARLVGYLARDLDDALRVFCDCPLEVRAERFQGREPGYSLDDARRRVQERDEADTANLRHLHGIDYHDSQYYHLVVSTADLDPDQVAAAILAAARE
ncbi:MAG: family ATPase [Armatimonadetes bacterium]|nr:family ATPase [Armatimonadota bacterium]